MNYETYQIMLYVLSFLAVIVFIALYFVKAGYGMFRTRARGDGLCRTKLVGY